MRKLTKTVQEYLAASGWSSSLFFEHAKVLFVDEDIKKIATFEVGRSVVYISRGETLIKVYVHHNGRTKEYLTLTNRDGVELATFHYLDTVQEIKSKILELLSEK